MSKPFPRSKFGLQTNRPNPSVILSVAIVREFARYPVAAFNAAPDIVEGR
jgi:hypothetical protein